MPCLVLSEKLVYLDIIIMLQEGEQSIYRKEEKKREKSWLLQAEGGNLYARWPPGVACQAEVVGSTWCGVMIRSTPSVPK